MEYWLLMLALIPVTQGLSCTRFSCKNGGICLSHVNGTISCLCLAGYVGDLCQFTNPCTPGRCQNSGTCTLRFFQPPLPPSYNCMCPPGFTGEECEGAIGDPCFPSPCQHGGTCQQLPGKQYQCQCMPGWTGKNCQLMDFCPANPCANGGTCVITYPILVCQCRPGFDGHACQHDINECFANPSPCLNGGSCINDFGAFHCVCPPSSTGPLCQYRLGPCSADICLHGSTCHYIEEKYHGCLCPPGYTGQFCEVNPDDCLGHRCHNGATCKDGIGSYSCKCLPGWVGLFCHLQDACLSSPCHPDAHCDTDLVTGHAFCTCQQGYAGALCYEDIDECKMGADPCEHGGSCHNIPGSFSCHCPDGYTGSRCESNLNECLSQPCHNGASCLDLLGQFQCLCPLGFSGRLCEIEECAKDHCLNGGTCIRQSHGVICHCLPGFEGPRCSLQVDSCASAPCRNGGQCQNSEGVFHCSCPQGFEGPLCEMVVDSCRSSPCKHGTCTNTPGSYTCICSSGFTGLNCMELSDPCLTWKCLNGGRCQRTESGPHCNCLPGWTGSDCGIEIDACSSKPCHQEATCTSHGGAFSCICPKGYVGATCGEDVDECGSSPCLNSGSCLNSPGSFRCLCPKGYTGPRCQVTLDLCSSNPCRNGGQCMVKESGPYCLCPPGWGGSQCQQRRRNNCTDQDGGHSCQCLPQEKCPNGRTCTKTADGFRCLCPPGTMGSNCELDSCSLPDARCFHGGTCVAQLEGYSCICPPGYVGKQCQGVVDACFSQPCHQSGTHHCQSQEHSFQCVCLSGYTGILCESVIDSCQSSPCHNGGTCSLVPGNPLEFICHCLKGYEGDTCDLPAPVCGSFFCHNGGICTTHPTGLRCLCLAGFSGPDCLLPPCPSASCPTYNVTSIAECRQVAGNGHCDRPCSSPETKWDGGDCSLGVDPWESCQKRQLCQEGFQDGRCQQHCSNEECLHDGFDCAQSKQCNPFYERYCQDHFSDGNCDNGCNTASCGWDGGDCWPHPIPRVDSALALAALLPLEALPKFLHSLAVAVRAALRVQQDPEGRERIYPYTGKEQLGRSSNWTVVKLEASERTIGYTIFLVIDEKRCSKQCPTSPKSALNILGALSAKGKLESLVPYTVVAAWLETVRKDPSFLDPQFSGPHIYSVGAGILVILLAIFYGAWRIRRPQRREHGSLWFPPGFAPHQAKKRRCRREPVGEDAIGLKPMKHGAEFLEDSDICSIVHFDGPLNTTEMKGDPDFPEQDQPRTKKQVQFSPPLQAHQKDTKPKSAKTQEPVSSRAPLTPLAHSPGLDLDQLWTEGQMGSSGETPLHLAARYSRADAARRLLTPGADANARDQWGRTPLHSAIAADALGVFQILLRHRQTDLDASANDGSTPLILATRLGVENMVEELVANRADIRAVDKRGKSAIHWAAAVNNIRATLILLRNGADKDSQDNRAQTPLFLAAQEGSYNVASLLLQHGAKQNIKDHMGRLPKDVALERLHHDILSLLDGPSPSHTTGLPSPHKLQAQAHRPATNLRKLPRQPCSNPRLAPVPENECALKGPPSPVLIENAAGQPDE